ncbi:MAG: DNA mismatch repair protein MutS [Lentisphaeria bacterium]
MNKGSKLTPAMRQYLEMQKETPQDAILLFRMGDFYELFFEDAEKGADVMEVVLTQRNGVPMCGVPYHAADSYIAKLVDNGYKVAVAEQMEDPSQAKGIVKRAVTKIITPGTVLEEQVLDTGRNNFLTAVCIGRKDVGLALLDLSTGDFRVTQLKSKNELENELNRVEPAECLVPQSLYEEWESEGLPEAPSRMLWTAVEDWFFDFEIANDALCQQFAVASLDGFGCRSLDAAVAAAGAVYAYSRNNLRQDASHLTSLRVYQNNAYMVVDRTTQRNLELVEPLFSDSGNSTLLNVLDNTVTPMGGRMLREWILQPLREKDAIEARLDAVEYLGSDPLLIEELQEALQAVKDLERTIARINLGSANGRDMRVLQRGLEAVPSVKSLLDNTGSELLDETVNQMDQVPDVTTLIARAIVDDPPQTISEGGVIREGYNEDLDELKAAASQGRDWIAALQAREQERTGIKSLKVRYNKVFGYYIEVTKANLDMIPDDYLRKQTLTNAERFITPELKELEDKVTGAEEKSQALEYELFQELRTTIVKYTEKIQQTAKAMGSVDVVASFGKNAAGHGYNRPRITDDYTLEIEEGRHPVIECNLEETQFVPNDTALNLDDQQLVLITGPNMAGKSTYIRQVALLVLMAQMGSFIPAKSATVGAVDRIFTRVGAADDIARGQSTFMVEMTETANILNNATNKSLIILDEIGRGTSTFDGVSLAWAVAEYLHDNQRVKARTLFATHYHELTELADIKNGIQNYNVAVREWGEEIIFLHKILPGGSDKSYGIHVARLAGLPQEVIKRARDVISTLTENSYDSNGKPKLAGQPGNECLEEQGKQSLQPSLFDHFNI